MRRAVEAAIAPFTRDRRTARVMHLEVIGVAADLEEHRLATIEAYAQLLVQAAADLVAGGVLAPRERSLTALALVGAMDQLVVSWLAQRPGAPVDATVDELVRLFSAALP